MRAIVGLGLVIVIAVGVAMSWSRSRVTAPPPAAAISNAVQAPAVDAKPGVSARSDAANDGDSLDRDRSIAARLTNVAAMQKQMTALINSYCKAHAAMPARVEDLTIPQMPASFLVDRIALRAGAVELHLPASELLPAGTIAAVPTMRDACPSAWQCQSADFAEIAKWLPGCAYHAASAQ